MPPLFCGATHHELLQLGVNFGYPALLGSHQPVWPNAGEAVLVCDIIHFPLANHQRGFRQGHSTTTALCEITSRINNGLNSVAPQERTIVTVIDHSKAFDTVSHVTLLHDVYLTSLPNTMNRWIANYLQGRHRLYLTEQAAISHLTVMIRGSTMEIEEALSWVHWITGSDTSNISQIGILESWHMERSIHTKFDI